MAKGKSLTKEEELLLQDFSRDVSKKSSALFYGNAALVSVLPVCKYTIKYLQYNINVSYDLHDTNKKYKKLSIMQISSTEYTSWN